MVSNVRPRVCKVCGRKGTKRAPISFRGYCRRCGEAAYRRNVEELVAGKGPAVERWLAGIRRHAESKDVGGVVGEGSEAV